MRAHDHLINTDEPQQISTLQPRRRKKSQHVTRNHKSISIPASDNTDIVSQKDVVVDPCPISGRSSLYVPLTAQTSAVEQETVHQQRQIHPIDEEEDCCEEVVTTLRRSNRLAARTNYGLMDDQYEGDLPDIDMGDLSEGSQHDEDHHDPEMDTPIIEMNEGEDTNSGSDVSIAHNLSTPPAAAEVQTENNVRRNISKQRTTRFLRGIIKPPRQSAIRQRWEQASLPNDDDDVRRLRCCSKLKCFECVNINFLREKINVIRQVSRVTRQSILQNMSTSSGDFHFDGRPVCSRFLRTAFRFSTTLQRSVRRTPIDLTENFSERIVQALQPTANHQTSVNTQTVSVRKDSAILFTERISEETGDSMPDRIESHLPFFRTADVYELYKRDFINLYPDQTPLQYNRFMETWKMHCGHVKVKKSTRFTKCSLCERLREALAQATRDGTPCGVLKQKKAAHYDFVFRERREYRRKRELSILRPAEYMSIVIDGADQTAFTLPHFAVSVKDTRGHGMKVHMIGLLHHGIINQLNLFLMTDEHETVSNHIIEVLHRFINEKAGTGTLPTKLTVQLDNCVRENKNQFLLSYVDCLVLRGVFESVEVSFLPIGHTHTDIDQTFSSTAERLRRSDAPTLAYMKRVLTGCYNSSTRIYDLKSVANWSGRVYVAKRSVTTVFSLSLSSDTSRLQRTTKQA